MIDNHICSFKERVFREGKVIARGPRLAAVVLTLLQVNCQTNLAYEFRTAGYPSACNFHKRYNLALQTNLIPFYMRYCCM